MTLIHDFDNEYGGRFIGDGGEDSAGVLQISSAAAGTPALRVQKTVSSASGITVGLLRFDGTSTASAAVMTFMGGFVSITSLLGTAATGAAINFDYVIPVSLNGVMRGIVLTSLISLPGAAAF